MKINHILKEKKNVLVNNFNVVFPKPFGITHTNMNKRKNVLIPSNDLNVYNKKK